MLDIFFDPIDLQKIGFTSNPFLPTLGDCIKCHTEQNGFPDINPNSLAIVGIDENRGSCDNKSCENAADKIRHYLYALAQPMSGINVLDLGNLKRGNTLEDTYIALTEVVSLLLEQNVTMLLLGGTQDLTFPVYKGYETVGRVMNICAIDSRFDIGGEAEINSHNYVKHIVMQQPNYLFNFTNIGYQTYFVGAEYVKLMDELNFDAFRVGAIQNNMESAEPLLRNADLVSVDISAVRQSDAPGNANPSPHGFYGEQLCQLARFAGMSDKVSSMLFSEYNPTYDRDGQTAHMMAHAAWYFIEGFFCRMGDYPYRDKPNYRRYTVELQSHGMELIFYKSKKSDRWWIEVPCDNDERKERYERHLLVPCNYSDYERAMENEIPELWWKYYGRMKK
ncbi:MAG: formimidoylglutamase [Bacteroidales bacterium]|nr:formimidoylglutamase [Candidatus Colimorpha pelethequi]